MVNHHVTAATKFTIEVNRLTFNLKHEILNEILEKLVHDEDKDVIKDTLNSLNEEMESFEKKQKLIDKRSAGPKEKSVRPLSAYNRFIKTELPNISTRFPELEPTKHMSKAAELWKKMSDEEKQSYKLPPVEKDVSSSSESETVPELEPKKVVKKKKGTKDVPVAEKEKVDV